MKKVEVLIAAMHLEDTSIAEKTNVKTDALIINQCDENKTVCEEREYGKVRCIYTTDHGVSRSRNAALTNATGDYCLLCDDDEYLYDGYEDKIIKAFETYPKADIICFKIKVAPPADLASTALKRSKKKYKKHPCKMGFLRVLKVATWQIAFRREAIINSCIRFDEHYGSGSKLGSGEENIFLYDCLKNGLKIRYVPELLGEVSQADSKWFKGFNEEYFLNRGTIIRRLMGRLVGFAYCTYFAVTKYPRYRSGISFFKAYARLLKGLGRDIR